MEYPYDSTLSADMLALLTIFRSAHQFSKPNEKALALIEEDQPSDIKAWLHTCGHHNFLNYVGDYDFEFSTCLHIRDLPQVEMMEPEQLGDFTPEHGIVFSKNGGGELFLLATWKPGATQVEVARIVAGGYNDDGIKPFASDIVSAMRTLLGERVEDEGPELDDEDAVEELVSGSQELFDLLTKPVE